MLVLRVYYSLFSSRKWYRICWHFKFLLIKEYSKHSCKWSYGHLWFLRFQGIKRILKGKFTSSKRCTAYEQECPDLLFSLKTPRAFVSSGVSIKAPACLPLVPCYLGKRIKCVFHLDYYFYGILLACRIF